MKHKAPRPIQTMGVTLPRNDLTEALVRRHVSAVQEYDHRMANFIENCIQEMASLYKDDQKQKHTYLSQAAKALYELDDRIGSEFLADRAPRLFTSASHGYILAELSEIRSLIQCAINTNEREPRRENKNRAPTKSKSKRPNRGLEAQ